MDNLTLTEFLVMCFLATLLALIGPSLGDWYLFGYLTIGLFGGWFLYRLWRMPGWLARFLALLIPLFVWMSII